MIPRHGVPQLWEAESGILSKRQNVVCCVLCSVGSGARRADQNMIFRRVLFAVHSEDPTHNIWRTNRPWSTGPHRSKRHHATVPHTNNIPTYSTRSAGPLLSFCVLWAAVLAKHNKAWSMRLMLKRPPFLAKRLSLTRNMTQTRNGARVLLVLNIIARRCA